MKHGLGDLRVIDFSSEIAGPYVTKLMADAGADVIKVEAPEGASAVTNGNSIFSNLAVNQL